MSTIVVLAILVIVMVGWLPGKTVNSMKRVIEHREDRFSPSLHLIDAHGGTRFCDEGMSAVKGAIMQPTQSRDSKARRRRIAQVRRERHEAIRRRRILVVALLALMIAVVGSAVVLQFSVLYGLIPCALLITVLLLGARASRQARAWELRVADAAAVSGDSSAAHGKSAVDKAALGADGSRAQSAHAVASSAADKREDAPTNVMEQREIRRALRRAELDRRAALSRRRSEPAQASADDVAAAHGHAFDLGSDGAVDGKSGDSDASRTAAAAAVQPAERLDDATSQLRQIHASPTLDAFDMAAQQDLISFSLGAARSGDETVVEEPESLEIKSTRQVATAIAQPTDPAAQGTTDVSGDREPEAVSPGGNAVDRALNDAQAFHKAEVEADVEVPDASSDSLGSNIEAVLARRANS
ncbi:hypothetical protein [Bifidobacterium sp.]|uniref:hypothetical protein n=1 Tax=Bifidobacterium sp. TaxID=41200 RepID=UPI0025C6F529|nr:hypothetical protein [Bifidobacterium sp.]MCH4209035.1 hypothetical protein [Bifidobacterium sp.]MCI1225594.1 hypothetical protein [Bifidobacterium sp.]